MTRVFTEDHERGTAGAALTTSNSNYTSFTGTPTFTTETVHGTLAAKCDAAGAVVNVVEDFTATTLRGFRRYFIVDGLPTGAMILPICRARVGGATIVAELRVDTGGHLVLRNGTTALATSTATVTVGQPFGIDMLVNTGASDTVQVRLYMTPGSGDLTETLTGAAGTGSFTRFTAGALDVSYTGVVIVDSAADDNAGFVGPVVVGLAPTANAGPDQTGVEPWSTVTLIGTDSDTDGAVVSRVWAQTAGPTVTLSGSGDTATFTAPATTSGTSLTFSYTVTDDDGLTGTDTVTVAVLQATEFAAVGGVWVPVQSEILAGDVPPPPPPPPPPPGPLGDVPLPSSGHEWTMQARNPSYAASVTLPISSAQFVTRHMGVATGVFETRYTPERWDALGPSCGVVVTRDGRQEFTGRTVSRQAVWDAEASTTVIHIEAQGDERGLARRLVFPDPLRASDDQTVNDYWTSSGVAASTAMLKLISDQAGPTCHVARQIPSLQLGADPGVGAVRSWSALFLPVLDQLILMSVSSGANLGLRMSTTAGTLTATITVPRNLADTIVFSADLGNLVGFTYREEAPAVTHAVAAGQGDLHARMRKRAQTTDPLALEWGEQSWVYVDRRDSADSTELLQAATDAVTEGGPTVSLAVTLTDSQAATYGRDWGLGDVITVYVGLPGQAKVATVSDVCREIAFKVDAKGVETITPAIGSYDAKAVIPTPSQRLLATVAADLGGVITRK